MVIEMKIAIVENEKTFSDTLKNYIDRYCAENCLSAQVEIYPNGLEFIEKFTPTLNIVFMDIEMPVMDGMETAKRMRALSGDPCLIFVTKVAQFAVFGYTVDAMDYMVKPIDYFDFSLRMKKAVRIVQSKKDVKGIMIQTQSMVKRVNLTDIHFVETRGHTLVLHSESGVDEKRMTLREFEEVAEKNKFIRINKCYVVNLDYLTKIGKDFAIVAGVPLQISRARKKPLLDALAQYLGGV